MSLYILNHRLITDDDLGENPQLLTADTKWEQGTLASHIVNPPDGYWDTSIKSDITLEVRKNRISTLFIPIDQYATYTFMYNKLSSKVNGFMVILTEDKTFERGIVYSKNQWVFDPLTLITRSAKYASISIALVNDGDTSSFGKDFNFTIKKEHVISSMQEQIQDLQDQINKLRKN